MTAPREAEQIRLGPLAVRRRTARALRATAVTFTAVLTVLLVLLASAGVITDKDFYDRSLQQADAYDRFYTEILADPQFNETTTNLLGRLPVDRSVVTSNLRVVIPPATLRALVGSSIQSATQYLSQERDNVDLAVAVRPLVDNIRILADTYLTDAIVNTDTFEADNLEEFGAGVEQFFSDVDQGRQPTFLPTVPLDTNSSRSVAGIIVANLPPEERVAARPQLEVLLAAGDFNGALALAAVNRVQLGAEDSARALTLTVGDDGKVDFTASVDEIEDSAAARGVQRVRFVLGTVYPFVLLGLILLIGLGLAVSGWITRRLDGRASRWIAAPLIVAGLVAVVLWIALRAIAPDPLAPVLSVDNQDMAPSVRAVLSDAWGHAQDNIDGVVVGTAVRVALIGVTVLVVTWLVPILRRWWRTDRRKFWLTGAAIVLVVFVLPLANVSILIEVGDDPRACNGHRELCDRPYDEVAYVGSHNAMAAADRNFLSAMQDLTMSDQLEQGVRALLIDAHYWERPEEITEFLDSLPDATADGLRPLVEGADPPKPGAWWCHALCRMGSEKLDDGFEEIKDFVAKHPDEVVTLVIEDYVTRKDIEESVRASGLDRFVFTPRRDPDFAWPTLGEMIDADERVVILAENEDNFAPPDWYGNVYRYAMETPYDHPSPARMSCAPNRGDTGKRLFLMNHWITRGTGSRADAGIVNQRDFILQRARRCERLRKHMVNIVAVDFTTIGDVVGAVETLNDVKPSAPTRRAPS